MAQRKHFINVSEPSERLTKLMRETQELQVTSEQMELQRISFAYGNALGDEKITKESVTRSSRNRRLVG